MKHLRISKFEKPIDREEKFIMEYDEAINKFLKYLGCTEENKDDYSVIFNNQQDNLHDVMDKGVHKIVSYDDILFKGKKIAGFFTLVNPENMEFEFRVAMRKGVE